MNIRRYSTLHDTRTASNGIEQQLTKSQDGYLVIHVEHSRERLMVELSYPSALLPEAQAENVASTYRQVLSEVLISPQKTIAEINFMSPRHLGQIWSWNRDTPEVVSDCVHLLFETRAKTNSKAQAVDAPDGTLTYGELHELSNRLAYHLVDLGVGPEVAVPLFFEKSKWAIITMLAVIKAGGAIVNLDANQPTARLIGLMEQLGATLALTSRRYEHLWEDRMKVCVVDEGSIAKLPVARAPPAVGIRPSNLLYIIFTSGSTGTPKGVVVEHESFLTAAAQHVKASNMTASSRVLQMTPYTFDVSMLEIFTTLTTGACVCFPGDELAQKGISAIINGLGITWTFMTPSLIRLVDPADVPTLQTLALGGEALGRIDVTTWAERLQLINGKAFAGNYEATECGADD
jgi:non-ribosomal peptide synthetase component F